SEALAARLGAEADFEIVTEPVLSLFSFRHTGARDLDAHNLDLARRINDDGRIYLTQSRVDAKVVIRFQAGQFEAIEADVEMAFDVITAMARANGR
ncbi:MAG: aspartate aminotransferase family protein, partial [Rhizobiaceae bacterium]